MFENPGNRIKSGAKAVFVFNVIVGVVLGILLAPDPLSGEFRYVVFFSLLLGIPFASYWECLLIYGFGELVENSEAMRGTVESLKEIKKTGAEQNAAQKPVQNSFSPPADGKIACSVCGFEQPNNRKVCWKCGCHL